MSPSLKRNEIMPRLIVTAQVEDAARWRERFRTHGDLFRALTTTVIHFGTTENNEVALYEEVDDLDRYFELLESPATLEAMAADGVRADTVKVFVLDEEWHA